MSNGSDLMHRPLEGLTVIDLTRALAGPYATMLLAGLGAKVIKVEEPKGGDLAREPRLVDERAERRRGHGEAGRDGDLRRDQLAEGRALAAERGAVVAA